MSVRAIGWPVEAALLAAVSLAIVAYLFYQVRKPSRGVGQLFLLTMNASHAALTDWALERVWIERRATILDVGCGGGAAIAKLAARAPGGTVYGIDHAPGSIVLAKRTNARNVEAGRVRIERAGVSSLPFGDGVFDIVTAIETQYYWPNVGRDMREILRVLKPGGTLIVAAEDYEQTPGTKRSLSSKLVRYVRLSAQTQRETFEAAGFTNIQITEDRVRGWISATGRKPLASQP